MKAAANAGKKEPAEVGAVPVKTCGCTGVRWCAACRAPERRRAWKMRPPIQTLAFLEALPLEAGRKACGSEVHLFDVETQCAPGLPGFSGLLVLRDFVSDAEAASLLSELGRTSFTPAQSGKQKQHFGPKVNFRKSRINTAGFRGLPRYASWIEARLRERLEGTVFPAGLTGALVRYVTTDVFVLRYIESERSNLDVHIDDTWAYGEVILDLSLGSDGWMTFLDRDPHDGQDGPFICVRAPLPARSLAVLFGPARFDWHHGIIAGDIQGCRTSITLRTLGEEARDCEEGRAVMDRAEQTCS